MLLPLCAVIGGLLLLVWSADRFIDGAAGIACYYGMPPLLVGMLIIGFGTSAPEIVVSAFAAWQGTPGLALGNAYGSNIANIGLIIGLSALLSPLTIPDGMIRRELPVLLAITALAVWQLRDLSISRPEALVLLGVFFLLVGWSIYYGMRHPTEVNTDLPQTLPTSATTAWLWTIIGIVLLTAASRAMVWGAATIARYFGIDDLIIGLTIFAVGTSLPELASALSALRKQQHDIVLGNIIGSNLFNTLAVVGIAGVIHPMTVSRDVLWRDLPIMAVMTLALFGCALSFTRRPGRINRLEGALLLATFIAYNAYLIYTVLPIPAQE